MYVGQVTPLYTFDIPNDTGREPELGDEWNDYENKEQPSISYMNGQDFSLYQQ